MNTAAIYIKTDPKVKAQAQKVAKELGFSLSSLLNGWLRQLIKSKTVTFSSYDEYPNEATRKILRQAELNWKKGKVSPSFDSAEDAITWLNDPKAKYQNGDRV